MALPISNDAALIAAAILLGQQNGTADAHKLKALVDLAFDLKSAADKHNRNAPI